MKNIINLTCLLQPADVCLLNMPLSMNIAPSIGLGLLKSILERDNIKTSVIYANLLFTERVGFDRINKIASLPNCTTNIREWLFSGCVFPDNQQKIDDYFKLIIPELDALKKYNFINQDFDATTLKNELLSIRTIAVEFIEELANIIISKNPKIVGSGSVGQQNLASLAILKKVKEKRPEIITIMGGPNCYGKMGLTLVKHFPWLDFICSGEADDTITPFCKTVLSGNKNINYDQLPLGIFNKAKVEYFERNNLTNNSEQLYGVTQNLNSMPTPEYSDFFITLKKMSYKKKINPLLPLESSRGCWWGKCTFCALCSAIKTVRLKSPKNVFHEIKLVSKKYKVKDIFFVDTVLPMRYFKTLMPLLSSNSHKCNIFYEVKSNLLEHHVKQLTNANIRWIQPGIEALHDEFLTLMEKGASTVVNLNFLKNAMEYGTIVMWVFLANFPRENIAWFNRMADEMPLFHHFHPPVRMSYLMFHRFSHYYNLQDQYNLKMKPYPSFHFLYPLDSKALADLSYDFHDENYGVPTGIEIKKQYHKYKEFIKSMQDWQTAWHQQKKKPLLIMKNRGNKVIINDTRKCAVSKKHTFNGIFSTILNLTHHPITINELFKRCIKMHEYKYSESIIHEAITTLKENKILYEHNKQLINLALKQKRNFSYKFKPRSDPCF